MSTKNNAVVDLALVLTEDEICELYAEEMEKRGCDCEDVWSIVGCLANDDFSYESDFTGELLDPETLKFGEASNECFCGDPIFYISASKWVVNPFKQAYKDMNEVVEEFKRHPLCANFPKDFDYESHIRVIVGTCYG